jgi:UDP-N-acetylmuramate--alanine ligase
VTLQNIHNVYLVGIGGIGMSALARWFAANEYHVGGYDKTKTPLTNSLESEGIQIQLEEDWKAVPEKFKDISNTLVIYTPAIPASHEALNKFKEDGFQVCKRAEVLGLLTHHLPTIGIAGTHGKTTTSSMVAHLMKHSGKNISAFLGGITANYGTNILIGEHQSVKNWVVVEADEYDRSFWQLSPTIAVVNNMDPDHLDIYETEDEFRDSFQEYLNKVKPKGTIIMRSDVALHKPVQVDNMVTFGIDEHADYRIVDVEDESGGVTFSIDSENSRWNFIRIEVPGMHNVMNATAAWLAGYFAGLTISELREGLKTFKGVKRRFEIHYKSETKVYIDDYAHHPTELNALLQAAKSAFPNQKITLIFQPHLYSRTRDFMDEFADALSQVDDLMLLDVYPARELPIPGITSEELLKKINLENKQVIAKSKVLDYLNQIPSEVIVTAGAGDIDQLCQPIAEWCKLYGA